MMYQHIIMLLSTIINVTLCIFKDKTSKYGRLKTYMQIFIL
jgi:hypothetical protein